MNLALPSLHAGALEISLTVPSITMMDETQFSEKKLKMKLMVSFVEY